MPNEMKKPVMHGMNRGFIRKRQVLALIWVGLFLLGATPAIARQKTSEILWDTYGVPHIYAKNAEELFYGFGWAQAQSHGNLLLKLYGEARGKAAQYWGEPELDSDRWVHTMDIPNRAQDWYQAQSPQFRRYLDAFAAGVNTYGNRHPEAIDEEMAVVLPVSGVDILAHCQRVLQFSFIAHPQAVADLVQQWQAPDFTPGSPSESTPEQSRQAYQPRNFPLGSNAWAIAPSRSASGHALLLANPHTPWSEPFLWYEAQLVAPGMNAYGASLVGIPVLNIAFNDRLGWTHTVNTHDGWDAYELTLMDPGYRFDGQVRPFSLRTQPLKIRQTDGTWREEILPIQQSIHGPIISQKPGKAIALRVVGLEQPRALEQWWQMAHARNLKEFETALKPLQIPTFSILYADRDGHILHLFNGQIPIRTQGNFEDWQGIQSGDRTATLWTRTHPYPDLPRVLDPPSGWLQNANDPPWTTTFPPALEPSDYPATLAPPGPMSFRAQQSARLVMADPQISLEELIQYKHSTRMALADRLLDDLLTAVREHGSPLAKRAAEVLGRWDRQSNATSRGAVLFATWAELTDFDDLFAVPWKDTAPLTTPSGLANPSAAIALLETAATQVESAYGELDVPWGTVFRLRSPQQDLPASGADGWLGVFRTLNFVPDPDQRFRAIDGDSFVAVIEFSQPIRAKVINSHGNASQPELSTASEQLQYVANQELRPVWRSPSEVRQHLVQVTKLPSRF